MKKLFLFLICCTACALAAAQNAVQMDIELKSGDVVSYQLSDIQSLSFSDQTDYPTPDDNKTYAINIPTDFSANNVMRVMAEGQQVAEICLEYINTANAMLTVIYPIGINGRANLAYGMCADNGGTVAWSLSNNICHYNAGKTSRIATVYMHHGQFSTKTQTTFTPTTIEPDVIYDKRGDEVNTYRTVKIGTQYWMAQNLNATRYRNNQKITFITSTNTTQWRNNTDGAYHVYADDEEFRQAYGPLYNGYALSNPAKLAPSGWDIPEIDDFKKLKAYLGTESGLKMKSDATAAWNEYQDNAPNNLSGFSAVAAGFYFVSGDGDYALGTDAWFWTKTEYNETLTGIGLNTARLNYATKSLTVYSESSHPRATYGHSVRCIRK